MAHISLHLVRFAKETQYKISKKLQFFCCKAWKKKKRQFYPYNAIKKLVKERLRYSNVLQAINIFTKQFHITHDVFFFTWLLLRHCTIVGRCSRKCLPVVQNVAHFLRPFLPLEVHFPHPSPEKTVPDYFPIAGLVFCSWNHHQMSKQPSLQSPIRPSF